MSKVVYFIRAGKDGPVKIGWSSDLKARVRNISQGLPDAAVLEATIPGGRKLEKRIHGALHQSRRRLEWFNPTDEVRGLIIIAKAHGRPAVERWLALRESMVEVRRPDFTETDDFDADIRWLTRFAFKTAVERHGYPKVCEAVGLSYDCVNGYINGRGSPNIVAMFGLVGLDPGAVAPMFARAGDVPEWITNATYNDPVRAA